MLSIEFGKYLKEILHCALLGACCGTDYKGANRNFDRQEIHSKLYICPGKVPLLLFAWCMPDHGAFQHFLIFQIHLYSGTCQIKFISWNMNLYEQNVKENCKLLLVSLFTAQLLAFHQQQFQEKNSPQILFKSCNQFKNCSFSEEFSKVANYKWI